MSKADLTKYRSVTCNAARARSKGPGTVHVCHPSSDSDLTLCGRFTTGVTWSFRNSVVAPPIGAVTCKACGKKWASIVTAAKGTHKQQQTTTPADPDLSEFRMRIRAIEQDGEVTLPVTGPMRDTVTRTLWAIRGKHVPSGFNVVLHMVSHVVIATLLDPRPRLEGMRVPGSYRLPIEDPRKLVEPEGTLIGYDVTIRRTGKGLVTRYSVEVHDGPEQRDDPA